MKLNNRELSDKLVINFAKWKRWSREFLPPDIVTSLGKGYRREYKVNEAFMVYLGGYLVGTLGYAIPEARKILAALSPWLQEKGQLPDNQGLKPEGIDKYVQWFEITIYPTTDKKLDFFYYWKGHIEFKDGDFKEHSTRVETYIEGVISPESSGLFTGDPWKQRHKVIPITYLVSEFKRAVG